MGFEHLSVKVNVDAKFVKMKLRKGGLSESGVMLCVFLNAADCITRQDRNRMNGAAVDYPLLVLSSSIVSTSDT